MDERRELIDKLQEVGAALSKATPGEWRAFGDDQGHPCGNEWFIDSPEVAVEDDTGWIAGPDGGDGIATTGNPGSREDAEAIVAAVNFLRKHGPRIEAALDHAIATIERERWRPIAEAPEGEVVEVYTPDRGDGERHDFDSKEDGVWLNHAESYEHFVMVGGAGAAGPDCVCKGPSEQAPYTHWKRLTRPLPDPQPDGQEGS